MPCRDKEFSLAFIPGPSCFIEIAPVHERIEKPLEEIAREWAAHALP